MAAREARTGAKDDGPLIRCVGLQKWYGGVHALKGIDVDFGRSEVVGLVGDNGAGKSTLIKLLSGAHQPDDGHIFLEGREVRLNSPRDAMKLGIETSYQYTAMVPQMSIARNIFIGREPLAFGIGRFGVLNEAKMKREAMEALEGVELHLRSPDTPVEQLSGGERQGVTIARAMYFKTKVLILDEPTNHLSVKETNKVLDFVANLKQGGITSIFITHNLHHVYPISDRIVVMNAGNIEQLGTPHDIYNRPATRFAATFVGHLNTLPAATFGPERAIRPELISLAPRPDTDVTLTGTVSEIGFLGSVLRLKVNVQGSLLSIDTFNANAIPPARGETVTLHLANRDILALGS